MLIFKNNGLNSSDFEKVREESRKIYKDYGINKKNFEITIAISNKFGAGTNGRFAINHLTKKVRISLSLKTYKKFGSNPIMGTLRHEWAHFISFLETGYIDHGKNFKEVCVNLGGHMNKKFSTGKYSACSNLEYLKRDDKRYKLSCPCGATAYRDKLNKNLLNRYSCKRCGTNVNEWKIEDRG